MADLQLGGEPAGRHACSRAVLYILFLDMKVQQVGQVLIDSATYLSSADLARSRRASLGVLDPSLGRCISRADQLEVSGWGLFAGSCES